MTVVLVGFGILLVMILLLRVPIAFAMGLVGFFGFAVLNGLSWDNFATFRWNVPLSLAANRVIDTVQDYGLSIIPLFILMGNLITRSGLSRELYNASYAFLGHQRGGLPMTTGVAGGGFSAVGGSGLAAAATVSGVPMPPIRGYGYSDPLEIGSA